MVFHKDLSWVISHFLQMSTTYPKIQETKVETNLFADDSTAFEIGTNMDDSLSKIKECAKSIESYLATNSLTIHPKKCKLVLISMKKCFGPQYKMFRYVVP